MDNKLCAVFLCLYIIFPTSNACGTPESPTIYELDPGQTITITSPDYPDNYPAYTNCHWFIKSAPNDRLQYRFTGQFQIKFYDPCISDIVELYDSATTAYSIGSYCGSTPPDPGTTTGRFLYVTFTSSGSGGAFSGFQLEVTSKYDGSDPNTFVLGPGEEVRILSPNYPNNYMDNESLYWIVQTSPGSTLKYRFSNFQLESGDQCQYDNVTLYDSTNTTNMMGSYCGSSTPKHGITTGRYLYVSFNSNGQSTYRGFELKITSRDYVCGSSLSPTTYELYPGQIIHITSENYPKAYPGDDICYWLVKTVPGNKLKYRFIGQFFVFDHDELCSVEGVSLYDSSTASNLIGSYCGGIVPPPGITNDRYLYIRFKTDREYHDAEGFNLEISSQDEASETSESLNTYVLGAGQTLVISTPRHPRIKYPNNLSLHWIVQTSPGRKLKYRFREEFGINFGDQCQYDNVTLYDSSTTTNMIGSYCGYYPPNPGTTTGRYLYVSFKSSSASGKRGFKLEITSNDYPCGSSDSPTKYELGPGLTGRGHTINITSPNYPNNYPYDTKCYWLVQAVPGKKINYRFIGQFQLQHQTKGECDYDMVTLYDSSNTTNVVGSYCGSSPPNPGTTTGRNLLVSFESNHRGTFAGFNLEITSDELDSTDGLTAVPADAD